LYQRYEMQKKKLYQNTLRINCRYGNEAYVFQSIGEMR
jgi:hypothetical protein